MSTEDWRGTKWILHLFYGGNLAPMSKEWLNQYICLHNFHSLNKPYTEQRREEKTKRTTKKSGQNNNKKKLLPGLEGNLDKQKIQGPTVRWKVASDLEPRNPTCDGLMPVILTQGRVQLFKASATFMTSECSFCHRLDSSCS